MSGIKHKRRLEELQPVPEDSEAGPLEQTQVRRNWKGTWKKPKQEPEPEDRRTLNTTLAALRSSAPEPLRTPAASAVEVQTSTPRKEEDKDILTPRRQGQGSAGDVTPRGRAAGSPFLRSMQGLLSLRRSSNLGSPAPPPAADPDRPDDFSPLGGALAAPPQPPPSNESAASKAVSNSADSTATRFPGSEGKSEAPLSVAGKMNLAAALAAEAASRSERGQQLLPILPTTASSPEASQSSTPMSGHGTPVAADALGLARPGTQMTLGAPDTREKRRKGKRSPKQSASSAEGKEGSVTPDTQQSLPSPTLVSIRKLLRRQTPSKEHSSEEDFHPAGVSTADEVVHQTGEDVSYPPVSKHALARLAEEDQLVSDDIITAPQPCDSPLQSSYHKTGRRLSSDGTAEVISPIAEKAELKVILAAAKSQEEAPTLAEHAPAQETTEGPAGLEERAEQQQQLQTVSTVALLEQDATAAQEVDDEGAVLQQNNEQTQQPAGNNTEAADSTAPQAGSIVSGDESGGKVTEIGTELLHGMADEMQQNPYDTEIAAISGVEDGAVNGRDSNTDALLQYDGSALPEDKAVLPFIRAGSESREIEGVDSPLVQVTTEDPSPAQVVLQAVQSPIQATPGGRSGHPDDASDSPGMAAEPQSPTVEAPSEMSAALSPAMDRPSAVSEHLVKVAATASLGISLEARRDLLEETGAKDELSSTPEPSPAAERLVSERSLDAAEFTLLQEVMAKPLDAANHERVQAIAAELFQEMQAKQACAASPGAASLNSSLIPGASPGGVDTVPDEDTESAHESDMQVPSSETDCIESAVSSTEGQEESVMPKADHSPDVLDEAPAVTEELAPGGSIKPNMESPAKVQPALPAANISRHMNLPLLPTGASTSPQMSPRAGLSPSSLLALRAMSPLGRHSPGGTPRLPPSGKPGTPGSAGSSELDSPLEEAVDELISQICDIEHVHIPPTTSKKAAAGKDFCAASPPPALNLDVEEELQEAVIPVVPWYELPPKEADAEGTQSPHVVVPDGAAGMQGHIQADAAPSAAKDAETEPAKEQHSSTDEGVPEGSAASSAVLTASVAPTRRPLAAAATAKVESGAIESPIPRTASSPRRRSAPLLSIPHDSDENALPPADSPAASLHQQRPRTPNAGLQSPGSKPPTAKATTPTPSATTPPRSPLSVRPQGSFSMTLLGIEQDMPLGELTANNGDDAVQQAATPNAATTRLEASPEAEEAFLQSQGGAGTAADALATPAGAGELADEADAIAEASSPGPASPLLMPPERDTVQATAAVMETPAAGLMAVGEPRQPAADGLETPASVVPFPGFGPLIPGGGEATPVTAPPAANPAAFLNNNNCIFSQDTPGDAESDASTVLVNRQLPSLRIRIQEPEATPQGGTSPLERKFNLDDFSPPASRRISTGHTPPLYPSSSKSAEDLVLASPPSIKPAARRPSLTDQESKDAEPIPDISEDPLITEAVTPRQGATEAGYDDAPQSPGSPVFDESFAAEAELIAGCLVTPAPFAKGVVSQDPSGPQQIQEAAPAAANEELEGDRLAQKACEMVEEAAAEIGLLGPDTERLVKVLTPALEGLLLERKVLLKEHQETMRSEKSLRSQVALFADEIYHWEMTLKARDEELAKVRQEHAATLQQFKVLYRNKYVPLKTEYERSCEDMQRLREGRAAAMEATEKWRAQVATAQLQLRKADLDAEAAAQKIERLLTELQASVAEAQRHGEALTAAEADAQRAKALVATAEEKLRSLRAECDALAQKAEEAATKVAVAQAARDRAMQEGFEKEEQALTLRKRLHDFKHENDKFASIKQTLKEQAAQLQVELDEKTRENKKLLDMCESLMSELEQTRASNRAAA